MTILTLAYQLKFRGIKTFPVESAVDFLFHLNSCFNSFQLGKKKFRFHKSFIFNILCNALILYVFNFAETKYKI